MSQFKADISEKPGILPLEDILLLLEGGIITSRDPVLEGQVQPASIDLRLGQKAYRVRASFLPGLGQTVEQRLEKLSMHEIDISDGAVLETGCVYIVPLQESLSLPQSLSAAANPKSSTGRLDVFTRVITDGATEFDSVKAGYQGRLYAEICPQTFPVLVRKGSRLSQIRFRRGEARCSDDQLREMQQEYGLVSGGRADIDNGVAFSVDLVGEQTGGLIGYRAKRHTAVIDVDRPDSYNVQEFWEEVHSLGEDRLILDPDEFYILASKEAIHVPPAFAAEMMPFNALVGEFRVHYAGFFDPGFGHSSSGGSGSRGVLEVRSHKVPFLLEHGQITGRLIYEPLTRKPSQLYGTDIGSHYQSQGLKLSKHFKAYLSL